jgi:FecR-like protein
VHVTVAGVETEVAVDSTVGLPARIVTGADGMLALTQARTSITVAADTDLEIPAEAVDGNLIARLVQHRGNVFYDVAHRDVGRLRVETPFLVAVIKGTQFNVAVGENSTTISLFEGELDILSPDSTDVIQLDAGEIAIRSRIDGSIRVVGMDENPIAAAPAAAPATAAVAADFALTARTIDLSADRSVVPNDGQAVAKADAGLALDTTPGLGLGASTTVDANLGAGSVDVALDTGVDLGAGTIDVALDTGVDLGAGSIDAALDPSVDLGSTTAPTTEPPTGGLVGGLLGGLP